MGHACRKTRPQKTTYTKCTRQADPCPLPPSPLPPSYCLCPCLSRARGNGRGRGRGGGRAGGSKNRLKCSFLSLGHRTKMSMSACALSARARTAGIEPCDERKRADICLLPLCRRLHCCLARWRRTFLLRTVDKHVRGVLLLIVSYFWLFCTLAFVCFHDVITRLAHGSHCCLIMFTTHDHVFAQRSVGTREERDAISEERDAQLTMRSSGGWS